MLELVRLSRSFGPHAAVKGISLTVRPGEAVALVGPNGAGKSAVLRMVAGFLAPSAGTAIVAGHDILKRPLAAKRQIGYLPQAAPLYPEMTAAGLLRFAARIRGLPAGVARRRMADLADRLGFAAALGRPVALLSPACRRRIALAQALLHDPPVLLLDAPTDGIDPNRSDDIDALLAALAADRAIVIATHRLDQVERLCNRAVIIAAGAVVADAAPAALATRSRHHNAVRLALPAEADAAAIVGELAGLPAVRAVEPARDADGGGYRVFPWHGRPIVGDIAELAHERGWPVTALRAERGRLDDVFRALTMPEAADAL
jgi:ABC-2 type transport system ATP-binding protein